MASVKIGPDMPGLEVSRSDAQNPVSEPSSSQEQDTPAPRKAGKLKGRKYGKTGNILPGTFKSGPRTIRDN